MSQKKIVEKEIVKCSKALGNLNDMISKKITVTEIKTGDLSEILMKDINGNIISWKASNFSSAFVVGAKLSVTFNLKSFKYEGDNVINVTKHLVIK